MAVQPSGVDDPLKHLSADDYGLLATFLVLIRDNYRKADKASYFLERRAGVVNTCSMTNLRDVLSHLATFLDPKTPAYKRVAQLASAEEHLRRAILEPYEIGLATLTEKFTPDYNRYREELLPMKDSIDGFATAPNRVHVDSRLEEINGLALKGKQSKGRNMWDDEWEDGVSALAEAYDKLFALHAEIEEWLFKHKQHRESQRQTQIGNRGMTLTVRGIVLTVVFGVIALIVTFVAGAYFAPRPEKSHVPGVSIPAPKTSATPSSH
jgi:hypothetical protein